MKLSDIFFLIELVKTYQVNAFAAGIYLAASYLARMITISSSMYVPRTASLVGTTLALFGYLVVTLTSNLTLFIVGRIAIGLSDIFSALQIFASEHFTSKKNLLGQMLKLQYAVNNVGTVATFFLGGFIYQIYGVSQVASIGVLMTTLQFSAFRVFLAIERLKRRQHESLSLKQDAFTRERRDAQLKSTDASPQRDESNTEHMFSSETGSGRNVIERSDRDYSDKVQTPTAYAGSTKKSKAITTKQTETPNKTKQLPKVDGVTSPATTGVIGIRAERGRTYFGTLLDHHIQAKKLPITWLNHLIAASNGITALTKGLVFTVGSLLMFDVFGKSMGAIGVINAACALTGVAASVLTVENSFAKLMETHLPSPMNLYVCLFGVCIMSGITICPVFCVYATGILLLNIPLTMFNCYQIEFQGKFSTKENYRKLSPLGQLYRRSCNAFVSFLVPPLYSVLPSLPSIVASTVCLIFIF